MSHLLEIMYQATFYPEDRGWTALERIGFIDLVSRRSDFENNPNIEIIFGEGAYDVVSILKHCENFFIEKGQTHQKFVHEHDPSTAHNHLLVEHTACQCAVIVMGDDCTETVCSVIRMKQSGIFYVVTTTTEKE